MVQVQHIKTKKIRTIHFGDSRYEQYFDSTGLNKYSSKNHLDKKRRESYFLRFSKTKNKNDAVKYEIKKSKNLYSPTILSHLYLW